MSKLQKLRNVRVREVSLVEDGDNPPARVVLFKRRPDATRSSLYEKMRAAIAGVLGREPSTEMMKRAYEEVVEQRAADGVAKVLMNRLDALATALHEILFFPEGEEEPADLEAQVRESLAQFVDGVGEELPEIFAGRIVKLREGHDLPPPLEQFTKSLRAAVEQLDAAPDPTAGPAPALPTEDNPMPRDYAAILKALPEDERKLVEGEVQKAKDVATALEAAHAELKKEHETLAKQVKDLNDARDPFEKALSALPAEQAEVLRKEREDRVALHTEVEKLKTDRERSDFAKALPVDSLPITADALTELIFELPVEKRSKLLEVLKSADQLAREARALQPYGLDTPGGGSAYGEIEAAAEELRKTKPTLTREQAVAEITKTRPDLYQRHVAEQRGAH